MEVVCGHCGHAVVVDGVTRTMHRVITVLSKYPAGIRRTDLRSEIGADYRPHFTEALNRLGEAGKITIGDHRIVAVTREGMIKK